MFLQNKIKITKEEAEKLREIIAKRKLLWDFQNDNFLCKDLDLLKAGYSNQKDTFGKRMGPVIKDLGSFVSPESEIEVKALYESYTGNPKAGEPLNLKFLCGPSANGLPILPGVSIYIVDDKKHKIKFWNGTFCNGNIKPREFITGKIIFELACYFDKRRTLYSKIQKVLVENAKEFSDSTTPEFIEDLILLFSGKEPLEKTKNFNIDFEALEERKIYEKFHRNNRVWVERMTCHIKDRSSTDDYFLRLNTEIWLDQKNTLIFNTYKNNCTDQNIEIEDYSGAKEFIEEKAKDMLEQLVSSTNFQANIYEQVKTKILLENI